MTRIFQSRWQDIAQCTFHEPKRIKVHVLFAIRKDLLRAKLFDVIRCHFALLSGFIGRSASRLKRFLKVVSQIILLFQIMSVGEQIDCYIDGHKLKRVDRFKYLGSYVTKDCKVDVKINARIQTASCAIGRLRERVSTAET